MTLASAERRRHVRASVSLMGTVESEHGDDPIVVLSLSASGAMLQAQEPPKPHVTYTLRFSMHRRAFALPFRVAHWLQHGDCYGWRGPFAKLPSEETQAIEKAVRAAAGLADSTIRPWDEIARDADREPDVKVVIGTTPAGQDITVRGKDVLEIGEAGLELYARLMCELETI